MSLYLHNIREMNVSENPIIYNKKIAQRFRGYLPVVVDIEAGGLNPLTDALLEIAAVTLNCDAEGKFYLAETWQSHVDPFPGALLNPESLAINKIDPGHPFRFAVSEQQALSELFNKLEPIMKQAGCNRCVLVGHNAWFDLAYVNAALARTQLKNNPFHAFTSLDTATLGALAYGQTVLAELLKRAGLPYDTSSHHSAIYDAERTAELFCKIVNQTAWPI